jgi:hypothetical protein
VNILICPTVILNAKVGHSFENNQQVEYQSIADRHTKFSFQDNALSD